MQRSKITTHSVKALCASLMALTTLTGGAAESLNEKVDQALVAL
jgi:hypothetical protein